jgi:hypothetical protein
MFTIRAGDKQLTKPLGGPNGLPITLLLRKMPISPSCCKFHIKAFVASWLNARFSREEFGVTVNQPSTYTTWLTEVVSSGLTGDLIWQAGSHFPDGDTPNDGYAVYPDGPVYPVLKQFAASIKARG